MTKVVSQAKYQYSLVGLEKYITLHTYTQHPVSLSSPLSNTQSVLIGQLIHP